MGTSTGYKMPKGGAWTPLKREGNRFLKQGPDGSVNPGQLLNSYVGAIGGPAGIARSAGGGGGGGGGGQPRGASAATRVARNVGGFISRVDEVGVDTALREIGLGHLVGASAGEIGSALLDVLCGPASTIDDDAARGALAKLNEEMLNEAQTAEDVERALTTTLDAVGLAGLLTQFFAHYIYERFCRDFYEAWRRLAGAAEVNAALESVRTYISSLLETRFSQRDVSGIRWQGPEGEQLVLGVLGDTCEVFGVPQ